MTQGNNYRRCTSWVTVSNVVGLEAQSRTGVSKAHIAMSGADRIAAFCMDLSQQGTPVF